MLTTELFGNLLWQICLVSMNDEITRSVVLENDGTVEEKGFIPKYPIELMIKGGRWTLKTFIGDSWAVSSKDQEV